MTDNKTYLDIPGEKSRELLARRQQFVARGVSSTMSVFAEKADGAVIDVPELVAAHRHERRAGVRAGAAADAGQRVTENLRRGHLRATVVDDHAVHLARPVRAHDGHETDV